MFHSEYRQRLPEVWRQAGKRSNRDKDLMRGDDASDDEERGPFDNCGDETLAGRKSCGLTLMQSDEECRLSSECTTKPASYRLGDRAAKAAPIPAKVGVKKCKGEGP